MFGILLRIWLVVEGSELFAFVLPLFFVVFTLELLAANLILYPLSIAIPLFESISSQLVQRVMQVREVELLVLQRLLLRTGSNTTGDLNLMISIELFLLG